ncbi:MAG: carbohydrate ABC transporter permease [Haloarculaceae archaeon]
MRLTAESGHRTGTIRRYLRPVAFHCLVWTLVALVLVPLVWPVMMTLNGARIATLVDRGILWWLRGVEFGAFVGAWVFTPLRGYLWNSVLVATATGVLSTVFAASGAYAVDRFEFPGRVLASRSLLLFPAIPQTIVAIPLYLLFLDTPLFDTRAGLVLAYLAFTLPFTTWLLIPYFSEIPGWLEDAARVDGASRLGAFVRIFLPNAKPGLAAAFVLAWMLAYNEFLFAVMLIDTPAKRTLPVGITYGVGGPGVISVFASLPMLVIFAFLWVFFLRGEVQRWTR